MSHKLGGFWTVIEEPNGHWVMRDHHKSIEDAVSYAEKMKMMGEGRVVIMEEVGEIQYWPKLTDAYDKRES